jgi:hypothetical protein
MLDYLATRPPVYPFLIWEYSYLGLSTACVSLIPGVLLHKRFHCSGYYYEKYFFYLDFIILVHYKCVLGQHFESA